MIHAMRRHILTKERTVTRHAIMAAMISCSTGGIISNIRDILLRAEIDIIILTMMMPGAEGLVVVARLMVIAGATDVAVEVGAVVYRDVEVQVEEGGAVLITVEKAVFLPGTDPWMTMGQAPEAMMEDPRTEVLPEAAGLS